MLTVQITIHHGNGGSIPVKGINQGRDLGGPCLSCCV